MDNMSGLPVADHPADRLVCADWLEEQGHDWGAVLRGRWFVTVPGIAQTLYSTWDGGHLGQGCNSGHGSQGGQGGNGAHGGYDGGYGCYGYYGGDGGFGGDGGDFGDPGSNLYGGGGAHGGGGF